MKRDRETDDVEREDGLFALLDDHIICRIFEVIARNLPDTDTAHHMPEAYAFELMHDMTALAATCKRLYAISHSEDARQTAWMRIHPYVAYMVDRRAYSARWESPTTLFINEMFAPIDAAGRFPGIRSLRVKNSIAECSASAIAACPKLERLDMDVARDTVESVELTEVFTRCDALRSVKCTSLVKIDLDLPCRKYARASVTWLTALSCCWPTGLVELDLTGVLMSQSAALAICMLSRLATLKVRVFCGRHDERCDKGCECITARDLLKIGNAPGVRPLERLSIASSCRGDFSRILAAPRFASVSRLTLDMKRNKTTPQIPASMVASLVRFTGRGAHACTMLPFLQLCTGIERLSLTGYEHVYRPPALLARPYIAKVDDLDLVLGMGSRIHTLCMHGDLCVPLTDGTLERFPMLQRHIVVSKWFPGDITFVTVTELGAILVTHRRLRV